MPTDKQLAYIDFLLDRHDERGTLEDVIAEINPDLGENEAFEKWLLRQSVRRASEIIDILKEEY